MPTWPALRTVHVMLQTYHAILLVVWDCLHIIRKSWVNFFTSTFSLWNENNFHFIVQFGYFYRSRLLMKEICDITTFIIQVLLLPEEVDTNYRRNCHSELKFYNFRHEICLQCGWRVMYVCVCVHAREQIELPRKVPVSRQHGPAQLQKKLPIHLGAWTQLLYGQDDGRRAYKKLWIVGERAGRFMHKVNISVSRA